MPPVGSSCHGGQGPAVPRHPHRPSVHGTSAVADLGTCPCEPGYGTRAARPLTTTSDSGQVLSRLRGDLPQRATIIGRGLPRHRGSGRLFSGFDREQQLRYGSHHLDVRGHEGAGRVRSNGMEDYDAGAGSFCRQPRPGGVRRTAPVRPCRHAAHLPSWSTRVRCSRSSTALRAVTRADMVEQSCGDFAGDFRPGLRV